MRWRTGVGVRVTLKLCTILLAGQKHNLFDIQMAQYEIALDNAFNKQQKFKCALQQHVSFNKSMTQHQYSIQKSQKMNHSNSNQAILLCTTGFIEEIKIVPGRAV